jgi:hypothetical protein
MKKIVLISSLLIMNFSWSLEVVGNQQSPDKFPEGSSTQSYQCYGLLRQANGNIVDELIGTGIGSLTAACNNAMKKCIDKLYDYLEQGKLNAPRKCYSNLHGVGHSLKVIKQVAKELSPLSKTKGFSASGSEEVIAHIQGFGKNAEEAKADAFGRCYAKIQSLVQFHEYNYYDLACKK